MSSARSSPARLSALLNDLQLLLVKHRQGAVFRQSWEAVIHELVCVRVHYWQIDLECYRCMC